MPGKRERTAASDPQQDEASGRSSGPTHRGAAWAGVPAARTPEELETLFEDALILRDRQALAELFAEGAVLVAGDDRPARGGEEIGRLALAIWEGDYPYVAEPLRVMQARDIALLLTERGVNVARRGPNGAWQYAIVLLSVDESTGRSTPCRST